MGGAALIAAFTLIIGGVLVVIKRRQAARYLRDERFLHNSLRANRWAVMLLLLVLALSPFAWHIIVMRSGLWESSADYWLSFTDVQSLAVIAVMFLFGVYLIADYVIFRVLDKKS